MSLQWKSIQKHHPNRRKWNPAKAVDWYNIRIVQLKVAATGYQSSGFVYMEAISYELLTESQHLSQTEQGLLSEDTWVDGNMLAVVQLPPGSLLPLYLIK